MSPGVLEPLSAEVESRKLPITLHGHYRLQKATGGQGLLVGFHGYGETAKVHLEALKNIPGADRWTLCAVQGPHVFYRQSTGEVVASWMTKFDREQAIADNVRFVSQVVEVLREEVGRDLPLVYAGFSQGVAMAYRAAALAGHRAQGLISLAGDVPPDLEESQVRQVPAALLGRGLKDKWYDSAKLEADLQRLRSAAVPVEDCVFPGGHEWHEAFLDACGGFLSKLARPRG
ncbi:MAG: phospholipase [Deltaproteobacteria bacterium]|nr:phospholipase [Deltaproteobacteria bacterium]